MGKTFRPLTYLASLTKYISQSIETFKRGFYEVETEFETQSRLLKESKTKDQNATTPKKETHWD